MMPTSTKWMSVISLTVAGPHMARIIGSMRHCSPMDNLRADKGFGDDNFFRGFVDISGRHKLILLTLKFQGRNHIIFIHAPTYGQCFPLQKTISRNFAIAAFLKTLTIDYFKLNGLDLELYHLQFITDGTDYLINGLDHRQLQLGYQGQKSGRVLLIRIVSLEPGDEKWVYNASQGSGGLQYWNWVIN
uniref:Uncharacterized protein n=1 Tax=Romanomermis culicivorax TaxID=13658 RepID=A0A915IHM9_ROMCU